MRQVLCLLDVQLYWGREITEKATSQNTEYKILNKSMSLVFNSVSYQICNFLLRSKVNTDQVETILTVMI